MAAPVTVACVGASSTAGKGQAFNWIFELAHRPQNRRFAFRNFGIGGDLSFNVLERVPQVLDCRPKIVVVAVELSPGGWKYVVTDASARIGR